MSTTVQDDPNLFLFDIDCDISNELDLGESVEEMRNTHFKSSYDSTPNLIIQKAVVNNLKTNLENACCNNAVCEKNWKVRKAEKLVDEKNAIKDSPVANTKRKFYKRGKRKKVFRKSDNQPVVKKQIKSLHCRENTVFIKKTRCRHTLLSLVSTVNVRHSRKQHDLLKFVNFALRTQNVLAYERKILLKVRHQLESELRKQKCVKIRRKKDENSKKASNALAIEERGKNNMPLGKTASKNYLQWTNDRSKK